MDRTSAYQKAATAIGPTGTKIILWAAVYDLSLRQIGIRLRCTHKTAGKRLEKHADTLAQHYDEVDGEHRRSCTPATQAAALAMVDPDDPVP